MFEIAGKATGGGLTANSQEPRVNNKSQQPRANNEQLFPITR